MSVYAGQVREAVSGSIDTQKLAEAWAALHPDGTGPAGTGSGAAAGHFTAKAVNPALSAFLSRASQAIQNALRPVLARLTTEAWVLGNRSALAAVDGLADVDWGGWKPGDYAAAEQIAGPGLRQLLDEQHIRIKSIADSRLEELSQVLEDTLRSNEITRKPTGPLPPFLSVGDLAGRLQGVLSNPANAELVAQAEIARAQASAARQVYAETGRTEVEISTAEDDKVCPVCDAAAKLGAHPLGAPPLVPLHPRCRCAELPVLATSGPRAEPGTRQSQPPGGMPPAPEAAEGTEGAPAPLDFPSAYEAHQWITAHAPSLGRPEARAVREYTEYSFGANSGLRAGSELSPASAKMVRGLDSAMRPLPVSLVLRRVVGENAFPGGLPAEGAVIADQAYASASLGPDIGGAEVRMVITAPAGTPAVIAGRYSVMPDQREVILARGTALRVDRVVVPGGGGVVEIRATVVPGGPAAAAKQLGKAPAGETTETPTTPETLAERMADAVYRVIA